MSCTELPASFGGRGKSLQSQVHHEVGPFAWHAAEPAPQPSGGLPHIPNADTPIVPTRAQDVLPLLSKVKVPDWQGVGILNQLLLPALPHIPDLH